MLQNLKVYLDQNFNAEEASLITSVVNELELMNIESDDAYVDAIESDGYSGYDNVVENTCDVIRNIVNIDASNALVAHGISLNENAKLSDVLTFIRFFNMVEDYENMQLLIDICNNDGSDDVEKLCNAIEEVVGDDSAVNLMFLIETINDSVIPNMKQYCSDRVTETVTGVEEAMELAGIKKDLRTYALSVEGQSMKCYEHVFSAEAFIGLDLLTYWKTYNTYLISIPEEAMLYEMVGFAIISEQSEQNPSDSIGKILATHYGDDIDKLSIARSKINQIIINLKTKLSSGVFVNK